MAPGFWSPVRRRAAGGVLALSGIALALAFPGRAPAIALVAIGIISLSSIAAGLRRHIHRYAPASAGAVGKGPSPPIVRFADDEPQVFCAGWLRPRLFVSTAALFELPSDQLRALVAHQRHHARRRDPLRLLATQALVDGLPFLSALRPLVEHYQQRLETAAVQAAVATSTPTSPADEQRHAGPCRFAPPAELAGGPPRTPRRLPAAPVVWGVAASIALATLALHASGLIDLSRLDPAAPGGQLCLVAMVALLVLGAATALESEARGSLIDR